MQTGLITLDLVSKINGVNIDMRAVIREYGLSDKEITKEELILIAKNAGFKAKIKRIFISPIYSRNYPDSFARKICPTPTIAKSIV